MNRLLTEKQSRQVPLHHLCPAAAIGLAGQEHKPSHYREQVGPAYLHEIHVEHAVFGAWKQENATFFFRLVLI